MSSREAKNVSITRLYRKKMWPLIVVFIGVIVGVILLVTTLVQSFLSYVTNSKLNDIKEDCDRIYSVYARQLGYVGDEVETCRKLKTFIQDDENICLVNSEGDIVYTSGFSFPDFDTYTTLDIGPGFTFYQERIGVHQISKQDFNITLRHVFESVFFTVTHREGRNWRNDSIVQSACWFEYPIDGYTGKLYVRGLFNIRTQEMFSISSVAVTFITVIFVLMGFVLVNIIINFINQKNVINQMYSDPDTGGHNWLYFVGQGTRILTKRSNRRKTFVVVNLHLKKYREYCSCYGLSSGEEILKAINGFFKARLDRDEIYARHSAADFALLLKCDSVEETTNRMRAIMAELMGINSKQKLYFNAGVYIVYGTESYIHGMPGESIGELCYSPDRKNVMLEQAYNFACDAAMFMNKSELGGVNYFSKDMLDEQLWERHVEDSMEQALINHEFEVYYQPKYNPVDNRLVAAEALVRWKREDGVISPGRFIPIFEKNGFITKLDNYMFAQVSKQQAEWKIKGVKTVPVSVNLSRVHFAQEDMVDSLCGLVDSYGTDHSMIEIEVTESALIENKEEMIGDIKALKEKGFAISMDDFGAGYSSLNSLKDLPLDIVKIDREFFLGEEFETKGKLIISSVIKLAKSMQMRVVAEGVELEEQIDFLAAESCDMIQGYYYAKPMPAYEFERLVARDA